MVLIAGRCTISNLALAMPQESSHDTQLRSEAPPFRKRRAAGAAGAVAGGACAFAGPWAPAPASASAEAEGIGQVSLLIGQARVVRKDGAVEPLKRGMFVHVGDRVETSASGHVHLRFIDNASVAVRPDSALEIQAYRFDAQRPADSEVRLQVDHGTTRSISGRATEVDKNRFRLNTPIAAIGVRGTDFIVQATESSMRATVAEGAIVVSALGEGCSAAGLGACGGADSRQLTSDMRNLMVEVQRGEHGARLVPVAKSLVTSKAGAEERMAATRAAETAARSAGLQAAEPHGRNDSAAADLLVIAAESLPDLNSRPNLDAQLALGALHHQRGAQRQRQRALRHRPAEPARDGRLRAEFTALPCRRPRQPRSPAACGRRPGRFPPHPRPGHL